MSRRRYEGIEVRHERRCPAQQDGECSCSPSYRASVYDARTRRRLKRTFRSLSEARAWRSDALGALRRGEVSAALTPTLDKAWDLWLAGAQAGSVRNRSGDEYKPSVIRSYEQKMRLQVLPEFGAVRLSNIHRPAVQAFVDRLLLSGMDASTLRNTLVPLRALMRRAIARGEVTVNPTIGLELPAVRGRRDRVASRQEMASLLEALHPEDRALWATAAFGGLRMGELRALRWVDVDLAGGLLRIERSWDHIEGPVTPKSQAGTRTVPIPRALRTYLAARRLACGWQDGLVFGRGAERPFNPATVYNRAKAAWSKTGLQPIGLHECRHTYASLMIAAGVNAKALSTYMGHSSVTITFDRYGHLMPGNEAEAARLLDEYLSAQTQPLPEGHKL